MTTSADIQISALLKKGRYFAAYNLAERSLADDPENSRIRQQYGLALARLGHLEKAKAHLTDLHQKSGDDPETAGILGSVLKSIYKKSHLREDAIQSRDIYHENYKSNTSFYTGINAASMSLVIGDQETATRIAGEIVEMIDPDTADFWALATLGEAFLLLGQAQSAILAYEKARNTIQKDYGIFNSVYSQLVLLEQFIDIPGVLKVAFKPPVVVVFTGHMIDHAERAEPRFPESITEKVAQEIHRVLDDIDAGIGYSSLACGADILFVEEMLRRGAEVNLFLPYSLPDFIDSSIAFAAPHWRKRFEKILESQSVNYITEEGYFGNDDLHALLGSVIFGKSILRAESFGAEPVLLTVLSKSGKKQGVLKGGTEYLVDRWPFKNNVYSIDPAQFITVEGKGDPVSRKGSVSPVRKAENREIRHILFADVVGYSKLSEDKTPLFVKNLLYDVAENLANLSHKPEILNTWGDSIFAVYSDIKDMMEFAIGLQSAIATSEWNDYANDNSSISMRIALHTGPVFLLDDPLTKRGNAFGNHINLTARMEPVTMPGSIYASDQFASVLKIESYKAYTFEYVGIIDLPKEFGKQEMYRINLPE